MPTQCDRYWAGLRCQLWAGHASAHAAREDDALISWRGDQYGDRVAFDWADREPSGQESTDQHPSEQERSDPGPKQPEP
jgi:hypothetical protein